GPHDPPTPHPHMADRQRAGPAQATGQRRRATCELGGASRKSLTFPSTLNGGFTPMKTIRPIPLPPQSLQSPRDLSDLNPDPSLLQIFATLGLITATWLSIALCLFL